MIIKKLIDICKKNGAIFLYDTDNEQWLSDGFCIFPMYNLPEFDENSLCKTYDITDKQQNKITFRREAGLPSNLCFDDCVSGETVCHKGPMYLSSGGHGIVPYMTSQGIAFINGKYLSPLGDISDNMLEIYERYTPEGKMYFAAKSGFLLLGIIMPYDCINESFVKDLKTLSEQCEIALFNKQPKEIREAAQGTLEILETQKDEGTEE